MNFKQKSGLAPQAKTVSGQWTRQLNLGGGITTNSVALHAVSICSKPSKRFKNKACRTSYKLHTKSASRSYRYCVECYRKRSKTITNQVNITNSFGGQHA
jgi:hypothetical protein